MSYTKLDGSGNVLSDSATSWVMVKDNVTGLIWENKTDDGTIHDKNKTYTWYDPTDPYPGTPGDGTDTKDFLDALNSARFGGYSDWRLPTIRELTSIVNHGIPYPGPTIDTGYFPNTVSSFYWSSTTYASYTYNAWGVDFYYGNDGNYSKKNNSYYVRAVRGGQYSSLDHLTIGSFDTVNSGPSDDASAATGSYTDNADGTVTDTSTGLRWQQAGVGSSITQTWEQALAYCEGLNLGGYTDWRLPTSKELESLVDYSRVDPAINTTYFPSAVSSFYWSSTTNAYRTYNAWGMNFNYGYFDYYNKPSSYYVRAVRGGQSGPFAPSVISVSPASRDVAKNAGATTFSVSNTGTGTMPWTAAVTSGGTWLSITSGASGMDAGTITCSLTANTSSSVRIATIRITAPGATGSPADVTVIQAPTSAESLAASFVGSGLWIHNSGNAAWLQVSSINPENMIYSGSTLYADFGASGLYKFNDAAAWTQLTPSNPENMAASGSALYADFGASGLYKFDATAWTQLTPSNPENMVAAGSLLYADFGASGLYKFDVTAWSQLTSADPENMVAAGLTLYADFGVSGLYKLDGTGWTQLTSVDPENMVASDSALYVDFGVSNGLYKWDGAAWTQLTSANPGKMVVSGSILYVDFGALGLYQWNGSSWTPLTSAHPENMVAVGSTLYADFGASGLYKWDGTAWSQLTGSNPVIMAVSN